MQHCHSTRDFASYYIENMEALGLPVFIKPQDNSALIYGHVSALASAIQMLGKTATLAELLRATFFTEKLALGTAIYASFYVGAAIGSLAVAAGRATSCGTQLIDVFAFVHKNQLTFPGWQQILTHHPEILRHDLTTRRGYQLLAKAPTKKSRIA